MKRTLTDSQRGFSLVELMVAIVIGLIVLAGVSSIMVSSKKTYQAQDSLARLQENARAAMLILTYDLRNIGYWGCNPDPDNVFNQLNSASSNDNPYRTGIDMEGSEAGSNYYPSGAAPGLTPTPRANTDALLIRGLDPSTDFGITQPMTSESAALQISPGHGIVEGEVLVVADCNSADIFQVTNSNQSTGTLVHNTGGSWYPGNNTLNNPHKLSKAYGADAKLMRYKANTYFIAPGTSGEPSLWRQSLEASASGYFPQSRELVEGIENLQILYGVDTDGDKVADTYVQASAVAANAWNSVVSLRFGIIARELANLDSRQVRTAATASQLDTRALDIDGDSINDWLGSAETGTTTVGSETVLDRQYQRRMFRTTVLLRNQQIRK